MAWYKWNGKILKDSGKIAVDDSCCCPDNCICDPMPSHWTVCVTNGCGTNCGTMERKTPEIACNPKWGTVSPIPLSCRLDAFTACGWPMEVSITVCYQNGICIISVFFWDLVAFVGETMTNNMSGTCNPFYHYSEWSPSGQAGKCRVPAPPANIIIEMTP